MKQFLLIVSLLLFHKISTAQLLKGRIIDGENHHALSSVVVNNINSRQIAITDSAGNYSIVANYNNELVFSYPGYAPQTRKMPPPQSGFTVMNVELFKLSYTLNEFVFHPKYTRYQIDSMERKAVYVRVLSRQKSSIASPVSWLAEKFNPNSKRIFKFQKSFNYWETQKFIDSRYLPEIAEQLTGLHGDTLASFMNVYPLPYDFARVASELEIKIFIRDSYKQWLQHPVYPAIIPKDSLKAEKQ